MTSQALAGLLAGVEEVRALRIHYPVPRGGIASGVEALAAKAHGRACVVLLSSHLERYIYAVNEEAVDWLNLQSCRLDRLPEEFLLMHSRGAVDEMGKTAWDRRSAALGDFAAHHAPLWSADGRTGNLKHGELLGFMKTPKPDSLKRFFKLYGIDDIFHMVTRKKATRGILFLGLLELVEKRNNIAHGDAQTEALPADVTRYLNAVSKFATSVDRAFARALQRIADAKALPW